MTAYDRARPHQQAARARALTRRRACEAPVETEARHPLVSSSGIETRRKGGSTSAGRRQSATHQRRRLFLGVSRQLIIETRAPRAIRSRPRSMVADNGRSAQMAAARGAGNSGQLRARQSSISHRQP